MDGADVADLAAAIGLPQATLADSVELYNRAATAGIDPDFGRPAATMAPLRPGPLYAIAVVPGVATTTGEPRRDEFARVLRRDGSVIPGLFAVGDNGSVWGTSPSKAAASPTAWSSGGSPLHALWRTTTSRVLGRGTGGRTRRHDAGRAVTRRAKSPPASKIASGSRAFLQR